MNDPNATANMLDKLGFPEFFPRLARREPVLTAFLRHRMHAPFEFYTIRDESPELLPFSSALLPLWEFNGDVLCAFIVDGSNRFIEYGYEWPIDDYETLATTYQDFLTIQFAGFYESFVDINGLLPDSANLDAEIQLLGFERDTELRSAIRDERERRPEMPYDADSITRRLVPKIV